MNIPQGPSKATQDPQNTPKKPLLAFPPNAKKNAKKTLRTPSMSRGISRGYTHCVWSRTKRYTARARHCVSSHFFLHFLFFLSKGSTIKNLV